jgi:hypothetical protein
VQDVISVPARPGSTPQRNQTTRRVSATVEKHDALHEVPVDSPWARFCDS